ncbi:MAG: hypothetical protein Q7S72_01410 [Candidatus Taylorbacteria bacterium]|nr:hypothetical protein [Candidatus Taylorbacteria bacterium]
MIQITSQEFTEFKKEFKDFRNEVNGRFDKIDKRFDVTDDKLDSHFETIGEVKVQVTDIAISLHKKANHEYVKEIDERTKDLEKVAFA